MPAIIRKPGSKTQGPKARVRKRPSILAQGANVLQGLGYMKSLRAAYLPGGKSEKPGKKQLVAKRIAPSKQRKKAA